MDQKNTIVKCKAYPNCLFNHNGVCDNYVINIGADGKCEGYVETARVDNFGISEIEEITIYKPGSKEPLLRLKEPQRGQRAKCNFYEDAGDKNNCDFSCAHADTDPWGYLWCCLNKCNPKLPLLCPHYIEKE